MTDDAPTPPAAGPDAPTTTGVREVAGTAKTPARPGRAADDVPRTARELRLARSGKRRPAPKAAANPLREGLRLERVPDPATFVLFGATGALPALADQPAPARIRDRRDRAAAVYGRSIPCRAPDLARPVQPRAAHRDGRV